MARIPHDPSLEVEPDFESETFQGLRDLIIRGDPTKNDQAAAEELADAHRRDRARRLAAWQQQVEDDEQTAAIAAAAQQELEDRERDQRVADEEAEQRERDKKKPKINSFNSLSMVRDSLLPRPSQFAIQKLKNFEYVELWYFTPEGCRTTSDENKSTASGSYTFAEEGQYLSLKSSASHKPSPKAIHDHHLSWRQFDIGKNNYLLHLAKLKWPEEHQASLALFFMTIISHEYRTSPNGERTLLEYESQVRRDWHDCLLIESEAFNISLFNDALLRKIADKIRDDACAERIREASTFDQTRIQHPLISLPYLPHSFNLVLSSF
ncbi:hypothetical protein BU15DRAFT_84092 [Melanogaster broomeanus]|nr:hypothetical protein BU15DRAFT_84092 [Melanogaster broomeanus]